MADQKLRELTEATTPVSTDLVYAVVDPGGTPFDRKVGIGTLLGNLGSWVNLAMNSPGQIYGSAKDGNEPEWWDASGSATITDEDTAGEGIEEKTERVFKVVTTGADHYGYQTVTFANESLLDAGETVISFSCWVWCDAATTASIGIYGTNLGLQESAQHTGGSSWELLTVENQTLDAADASVQLRLIVDNDTAYYTMPMLNVGSCSLPWLPRGEKTVPINRNTKLNLTNVGDTAWTDIDCTAETHPLATAIMGSLRILETGVSGNTYAAIDHSDNLVTNNASQAVNPNVDNRYNGITVEARCDDSQVIRYTIDEADGDNDVLVLFFITGYRRWAP